MDWAKYIDTEATTEYTSRQTQGLQLDLLDVYLMRSKLLPKSLNQQQQMTILIYLEQGLKWMK